ncbi:MAG: peptidoglycan DD-metalloendopeptidase family protein [Steroidobacteraceae bacterium]
MSLARAITLLWFGCASVAGCATRSGVAPVDTALYVVRAEDTLYGIAWRHNLDYHDLAKWNHIGAGHPLAVGEVLRLSAPAQPPTPTTAATAPHSDGTPAHVEKSAWVWPTVQAAPLRPVPGGGILLFGHAGQEVRAASAGRVVYTGSGLRGYGNLIIIKHGEALLSSYAHNRDMSVHEGEDVAGGQVIGTMGYGPHQIAALYFEIRVNGKPVDPLSYLPPPR